MKYFSDHEKKVIRVLEPWNGWASYIDESYDGGYNNDTGLCNRIYHWETIYRIAELNGNQHKLVVSELDWPETHLIELPNTEVFKFDKSFYPKRYFYQYHRQHFKNYFDTDTQNYCPSHRIGKDDLVDLLSGEKKLSHDNYCTEYGFTTLENLGVRDTCPLSLIKIKSKKVEQIIKNCVNNSIGVHIRRFSGVDMTSDDYNSIDLSYRYLFDNQYRHSAHGYPFIRDDVYFNIFDKILEKYPYMTFYISTDLQKPMIDFYKKRYGDVIKSKYDIVYQIYSILKEENVNVDYIDSLGNTIENVVDLFSLANSKFIIKSPISTWSSFAVDYNNLPFEHAHHNIEFILYELGKLYDTSE